MASVSGTGGIVNVGSTTESTSITTGALIVGGGAGINANIYAGGNITATSFNATSDYRIKQNVMMLDASFNVDVNPYSSGFTTNLTVLEIAA